MRKIILHCSPPAFISMPSPSLSILKGFLGLHGYESQIIYWNILFYDMQKRFLIKNVNLLTYRDPLLLYLNYIAWENKDTILLRRIKTALVINAPEKQNYAPDFFRDHMYAYKLKVDELLDKIFTEFNFSDVLYFGFTLKFEQWVFAYMLAIKLKKNSQIYLLLLEV